ncbi:hypothetical protein R6Z07M_009883 [Ovis aries]
MLVAQSCLTLCDPMDCSPPGSSVHGNSAGKNTGVGNPLPSPGNLRYPGVEPGSPALQADSLPSEPPGKTQMYIGDVQKLRHLYKGLQHLHILVSPGILESLHCGYQEIIVISYSCSVCLHDE